MPSVWCRTGLCARYRQKRTQFILASFFYCFFYSASFADCLSPVYHRTAQVKHVIDGDSLKLRNGDQLRLIAINTPEKARANSPAEPLAEQARDYVQGLLRTNSQLRLRFDHDKKDRHGRLLAHAFLPDGRNLGEQLLLAGLAAHITVPANLWGIDCYRAAENQARTERRGIWGLKYFRPRLATQLAPELRGFHFIQGQVQRIGNSRSAIWLNLSPDFAIRIPRTDLVNFNSFNADTLLHKHVIVRGWIYSTKGQLRVNLRHPLSLELTDKENSPKRE